VASFGDPALVHRLGATFSWMVTGQAPTVTQAPVVTADNTSDASGPMPPLQGSLQPAQAAQTVPAPSLRPAGETDAMRAQRKALQQQLQRLQAEMAQAPDATPHNESQASTAAAAQIAQASSTPNSQAPALLRR
jgi:hypothetical protein